MTEAGGRARLGFDRIQAVGIPFLLAALLTTGCAWGEGASPAVGAGMPLAHFFDALNQLERTGRGTVTILQLGDSHTAGNLFSGRLRTLFQNRFGSAGRGGLPPGPAYRWMQSPDITMTNTGWKFAGGLTPGNEILGMSGYRASADSAGARLGFETKTSHLITAVSLSLVMAPNHGTLLVLADGHPVREQPTSQALAQGNVITLPLAKPARRIELMPKGNGPVELLRVDLRSSDNGIIYESHGIIGATVNIINHWHAQTIASELAAMRPALIILVYGTNEGFNESLRQTSYSATFRATLEALRMWAPQSSLLVIGPPDADRLSSGCTAAEAKGCVVTPSPPKKCVWSPAPNLAMVREVQRQETAAIGAQFWDWSQVMGGACGIDVWVRMTPPLAYNDHVHFREEGYRRAADTLFDTIMKRYREGGGAVASAGQRHLPAAIPFLAQGCRKFITVGRMSHCLN